jgi:hypothetical protein
VGKGEAGEGRGVLLERSRGVLLERSRGGKRVLCARGEGELGGGGGGGLDVLFWLLVNVCGMLVV